MLPRYLKLLARVFGVEQTYMDLWGSRHEATPEQISNILHCMDVDAHDALSARAVLVQHRQAKYENGLDAVKVVNSNVQLRFVSVIVPDKNIAKEHVLRTKLEDGPESEIRFVPQAEKLLWRRLCGDCVYCKYRVTLPFAISELGYHDITLALSEGEGDIVGHMLLIVVPGTCYIPEDGGRDKSWKGIGVQLYSLRSHKNWGFGQFTDLPVVVDYAVKQQADFIGLNPLHAISLHNLEYRSPYSPITRHQLNVLNLDVDEIVEFEQNDSARDYIKKELKDKIAALRNSEIIDYALVRKVKLKALGKLFSDFLEKNIKKKTPRAKEFQVYTEQDREQFLEFYARYESLSEYFLGKDSSQYAWHEWPECYQQPQTPECKAFAEDNIERLVFYKYLQWHADRQLQSAVNYAHARGLKLGFYVDLALSAERGGSDIWKDHEMYALSASVGCPADAYAPKGQNWAFPPLIPHKLKSAKYRPFYEALRANMKYAGALRIDHAMSLSRLFWIPASGDALNGLYVRYPINDLIGILSLESQRNRCVIVGEDLGTVPNGFRELMARYKMLSYKVFFFMRTWGGGFEGPQAYPALSLVTPTTHDMHTLQGYWTANDIEQRVKLGFIETDKEESEKVQREKEKESLLQFLVAQGCLENNLVIENELAELSDNVFHALMKFLQGLSSKLLVVPIEDIVGQIPQVNVPGVTTEYPCWSHKLPICIEELATSARGSKLWQS